MKEILVILFFAVVILGPAFAALDVFAEKNRF